MRELDFHECRKLSHKIADVMFSFVCLNYILFSQVKHIDNKGTSVLNCMSISEQCHSFKLYFEHFVKYRIFGP
jgi:hypothetical protein